ncbi:hypothetical protein LYSHEL_29650 [Lysobacter helvus]|uniref:Uncharacterized protein n=2 Tax=Lysobacteraceae TaxID=32033 RepID=A0ABM7Q910_9GAMM|nr:MULTISPECIES: hypothetical protein [Lysobacter]BCT93938.1 hypothetical protein LYSCAS_29620 [Lysobacter caseinilyticus]BCT97094.1 hypothetical protein LYSHEL_29650 [Lysobacter helvus]
MTPEQFEHLNAILRDQNVGLDVTTVALIALFATHPDKARLGEVFHHWLALHANDATDLAKQGTVPRTGKLLNALEIALQGGFQPPRNG